MEAKLLQRAQCSKLIKHLFVNHTLNKYFCLTALGKKLKHFYIMEKSSYYQYTVEPFTEDYCGNLAWGKIGNLLLRCSSMHAGQHGFGYSQMIEQHRVWVLSRLVLELDDMPKSDETFQIHTWISRIYRHFTDRHFTLQRTDGSVYGHATSIWALIDTETRMPADLAKLAEGGFTEALQPDKPSPIAAMGRIALRQPKLLLSHRAAYCDLDINGHVNSIRYMELLIDQFEPEALKQRPIRRIEMAYCLEAYWGDTLEIYGDEDPKDPSKHCFEIRKNGGDIVVKGSISF